jgi:hypothetical protein
MIEQRGFDEETIKFWRFCLYDRRNERGRRRFERPEKWLTGYDLLFIGLK